MDTLAKLQEIFRDIFDDDAITITRETSPKEIEEWDSLAQVTIIAICESEFGVKFDLNDIMNLICVDDIVNAIESKKKQ